MCVRGLSVLPAQSHGAQGAPTKGEGRLFHRGPMAAGAGMPERDLDPNLIPSLGSHPWERGTPELWPSGLLAVGTSSKDACSEQACGSGLTLTAATSARNEA